MTFENIRAPLLCYFKLCVSFRSHWWIQTGVTVRKCPIWVKCYDFRAVWPWNLTDDMLCTAQLPGPVLKAFEWVQISPFQMAYKPPMITDHLTAGGSVSQLSQLAKLSPWLTLSTKYITTSFWHYKKLFCFLSNQIMGLYHFSNPIK